MLPHRYGGVDSLLLWQGYPNIGLDDKNQFEMTASLPGGLDGLKDLVSQVSCFSSCSSIKNVFQHAMCKTIQICSFKQLVLGFFSPTFPGTRTQTLQDRTTLQHLLTR